VIFYNESVGQGITRGITMKGWQAAAALGLAVCAATAWPQKLQADAEPVRDVMIVVLMGDLASLPGTANLTPAAVLTYRTRYKDAVEKRLPAIFEANGVPVRFVLVALSVVKGRARPSDTMLADTRFSHVLILNLRDYSYFTRRGIRQLVVNARFDGELWELKTRSVVWKASPTLGIVESQPLLQSQDLAAQLLNGMHADGLITLKQGHAVDFSGERISTYSADTPDR
jgi:hypothetical protein